jgi:YVTN family beta-propeller protein
MTNRRRPSLQDREPAVDLFDDPPWQTRIDNRRTPLAWLGHIVFALLVVALGLLGLVALLAIISLITLSGPWKLGLGPITFSLPAPSSYGLDIALSPDGTRAYVTEPSDNRLVVLNAHTGAVLATVVVGDNPSGLALSPDGTRVWVVNTTLSDSAPGSVTVVATATDSVVGTVPVGSDPIDLAFSPNGRWAYVTNHGVFSSGSVSVIDTTTLAVIATFAPPPAPAVTTSTAPFLELSGWNPTSIAATTNGQQLWVSAVNNLSDSPTTTDFVYVFNATFGTPEAKIAVGTGPYFMVLSRDGGDAYVADKVSCDVRQIDTATFRVVTTVRWPSAHGCPFGLAAGPTDNLVYTVTGHDDTIDEPASGRSFGSVDFTTSRAHVSGSVGSDPVTLALSPDGTTAYVVDAGQPLIDLVDPSTGAVTSTFKLPVPASLPAPSTTSPAT